MWFILVLLFLICVGQSDNGSSSGNNNSTFSSNDSPPIWCDLAFIGWILLIHIYYSYKFTEYSLNHIQRRLNEIENADYQVETQQNTIRHQTISTASFDATTPQQQGNTGNFTFNNNISTNSLDLNSPTLSINMMSPQDSLSINTNTNTNNGQLELTSDQQSFRKHSALTLRSGYGMVKKSPTQDSIGGSGGGSPRSPDDQLQEQGQGQQQAAESQNSKRIKKYSTTSDSLREAKLAHKQGSGLEILESAYDENNRNNQEIPKSKAKRKTKHKRNNSESNSDSVASQSQSQSVAEVIQELETVHERSKIDITVEYETLARPLTGLPNTRCLCILTWSPTLFSWSRTASIRLFLKIWILISSSLAFVLWMEFFGNALLEVELNTVFLNNSKRFYT